MLDGLRTEMKTFGPRLVMRAWFWRVLNRVVPCRALICIVLERADAGNLALPAGLTFGVAGPEVLARHIGAPGFSFTRESLERAERRGDECYAVFDRARLASFTSYSWRPTVIDGYPVYFRDGLVYAHHAFTHPDYRGLRLHAIGTGRALREYQSRGAEMIIADVDVRNLSSLKSVYRLGYRNVGKVYLFHPFGRHFILTSPGARRHGFRFGPPGTGPAGQPGAAPERNGPGDRRGGAIKKPIMLQAHMKAALAMETEPAMEIGTSATLATIATDDAFRALAGEWNRLADACPQATLFQRYEWPRSWWDVLSAHELYIVTMREGSRLTGVAPLMKSREKFLRAFPARRLDVMASYENRHDICLFAGDQRWGWARLLPYLASRRDWDVLFLNAQEEPDAPDAVLTGLCQRLGCGVVDMRTGTSPYLPLPATPEEFLKGLDGKFRKGLRGAERKLAEAGRVQHEVFDSRVDDLGAVLERLFAVSRKGWAHAELTAIGSTESLRKYYSGVAAMAQRNGWLQLHVLRVGERDVAFEFSLYYRGVLSNLKQGFDPELAAGSPGQVLKRYVVEDAIRRGTHEYDMLGVAEPYKLKWTELTRPRYKWAIFNRHPYARFLHTMQTKVWEPIRARRERSADTEKE